jgi:hypothetical protein
MTAKKSIISVVTERTTPAINARKRFTACRNELETVKKKRKLFPAANVAFFHFEKIACHSVTPKVKKVMNPTTTHKPP